MKRGFWVVLASLFYAFALAGCHIETWFPMPTGHSDYGPPAVPLAVKSFTFAPPGPIHTGDLLTFTAEIEPVTDPAVVVGVQTGLPGTFRAELHDDGAAPDTVPGDSIFSGAGVWGPEYGTGKFTLTLWAGGEKEHEWAAGQAQRILKVKP